MEQVRLPKEIFGQTIKKVEHQADIIRLRKLLQYGGIYLDTDVFIIKSFKDLLDNNLVMGIENGMGLCNAVILTEPNSPFIKEWINAYHPNSERTGAGFNPDGWGEMSVKFPEYLASDFEDYVTILPSSAFYQPSGGTSGLELLFNSLEYECDSSYANHLWASQAWKDYLEELNPEKVLNHKGYFYNLVRKTFPVERCIMFSCRAIYKTNDDKAQARKRKKPGKSR